ncbi:uncharacterized protein [Epargyreus clarus]|uniref:uncharacterized protein n=1 Tax=Epargyreus clarus TaxID=520877 RepID=UPI003C2FF4ED
MSFEVDRYSSAWAHIALCADLTWATEPPDDFIIANQRLWTQHCRVSQVLQESTESLHINNQCESTEKPVVTNQENGNSSGRRSVKDVIPESRLAQFYGNFYYDEARENCYTNTMEKSPSRNYCSYTSENSDLTECWMLPEVEYWFRKLLDEPADRNAPPRRRRQYRMLNEDDFGRWGPSGTPAATDEAILEARIRSVRALWHPTPQRRPRVPSPPPVPRKIRARRRQPRRINALAPPPPYCLDASAQLFCDPTCKFQFESPRPPQLIDCQRAMGRLSASVQAVIRASTARCQPYRGTNVTRYAPTGQRPLRCQDRRCTIWWPRDHPSPRLDHRFQLTTAQATQPIQKPPVEINPEAKNADESQNIEKTEEQIVVEPEESTATETATDTSKSSQREKVVVDGQMPCTSSASIDLGVRKKRLYSTVLSMSAPTPINLAAGCVRLSQKLVTPGLLRLNPKLVLPTRLRPPNVDNKFEELEKEALEQYKASDESIDTKFRELEKQAVEQYSTSNSNTSCSSGNSAEKKGSGSSVTFENGSQSSKKSTKFHKEKAVDSVVIYSQNFPDLNAKVQTNGSANLKNFHNPPRGEKKDHKLSKSLRNLKCDSQRAASDTDYDARESKANHKGPMRWTYHTTPKKRHLTLCASDFSSDEELEEAAGSIKDAGPCIKNRATGKVKMSAHGGGDLNPIMRKA